MMGQQPPNLDSDDAGTCLVCLRATDTALAFTGPAEWIVAGLMALGVPNDQAITMVEDFTGANEGKAIPGLMSVPMRVCESCAEKASLPVGLATGDQPIPNIEPLD